VVSYYSADSPTPFALTSIIVYFEDN